jgi:hypothetical protein
VVASGEVVAGASVAVSDRGWLRGGRGLRANQEVAAQLGIWPQTVTKWRRRFLDRRLEGLADEQGLGAPGLRRSTL